MIREIVRSQAPSEVFPPPPHSSGPHHTTAVTVLQDNPLPSSHPVTVHSSRPKVQSIDTKKTFDTVPKHLIINKTFKTHTHTLVIFTPTSESGSPISFPVKQVYNLPRKVTKSFRSLRHTPMEYCRVHYPDLHLFNLFINNLPIPNTFYFFTYDLVYFFHSTPNTKVQPSIYMII